MSEHGPARWSGSGKRSVQARDTSKQNPVAAPETGTEITVEQPDDTAPTTTSDAKPAPSSKGSTKTGD